MISDDEWRLIALAAFGFMLSMFILANEPEGGAAASWYAMLFLFWAAIAVYAHGSQGIGPNYMRSALIGAVFSGLFVAMHVFAPSVFNLGLPRAVESVRFAIVGILAPFGEELAFRWGIYDKILRNKKRMGFLAAAVISSAIFAVFHWVAYLEGAATAAYIGAFTFGLLACYVYDRTKNVVGAIVLHMVVNMFLLLSPVTVVALV